MADCADLARLAHVSRARISQIMNLYRLPLTSQTVAGCSGHQSDVPPPVLTQTGRLRCYFEAGAVTVPPLL